MKQTAVEWLMHQMLEALMDKKTKEMHIKLPKDAFKQAKAMEKEKMLDFGEFIIDELEPMAQNREWVEGRYNYFKSE